MAEISTEQIVKIVIAVFVLVVVLGGIYLVFRDKILSYFSDLTPEDKRDFSSSYYRELLSKNEYLVATLDDKDFICMYPCSDKSQKTDYYIKKKSVKLSKDGWIVRDKEIGIVKNYKISIDKQFKNQNPNLISIDGSEIIGKELRKFKNG